jgi:hypothetical protein
MLQHNCVLSLQDQACDEWHGLMIEFGSHNGWNVKTKIHYYRKRTWFIM